MIVIEILLGIVAAYTGVAALIFEISGRSNMHITGYWQTAILALGFLGLLLK